MGSRATDNVAWARFYKLQEGDGGKHPIDESTSAKTTQGRERNRLHLLVWFLYPEASLLLVEEIQICLAIPLLLPMG